MLGNGVDVVPEVLMQVSRESYCARVLTLPLAMVSRKVIGMPEARLSGVDA